MNKQPFEEEAKHLQKKKTILVFGVGLEDLDKLLQDAEKQTTLLESEKESILKELEDLRKSLNYSSISDEEIVVAAKCLEQFIGIDQIDKIIQEIDQDLEKMENGDSEIQKGIHPWDSQ